MSQTPDAFGINFSVADLESATRFYQGLYTYDRVNEGVYSGIKYRALMRNGEVEVCLFQGGGGSPLQASFPTIRVESVADCEKQVRELGGSVLVPPNPCPCTGAQFAICADASGNQFMIKEAASS